MNNATVEASNLSKAFGDKQVLQDLSFGVSPGDVVGVLGKNGAGKTTLLELMLGFSPPTGGAIRVFGHESYRLSGSAKARVGFVPQQDELLDQLTVAAQLRVIASFYPRWDSSLIERLCNEWGVNLNTRIKSMSVGERQKLSILLAFGHQPELLILDEPTAGLDPLVQQTFNELLFEARAAGRTVFLSSHIISEVERTCDRVAIIRDGRIVRLDTVEGVRALAAHEVELRFAAPVAGAPFTSIPGVINLVEEGRTLRMLVTGPIAPVVRLAGQYELVDFVSREPSLEEVFLSEYGAGAPAGAGPAAGSAR